MRELFKPSFTKVTECPKCGAPLQFTNTPDWVVRSCSEDELHYIVQVPHGARRRSASTSEQPVENVRQASKSLSVVDIFAELNINPRCSR
jgi:hypothetical protein